MWEKKGILFKNHGITKGSQLPVVDTNYSDIYRIYYSARDKENRSFPKYANFTKDLKLISDYPLNLELGKPGAFDSHGIMPTEVITLEDGTKYLYYIGWSKRLDVPYWNSIGLAISEDEGRSWKKYSEGPIFSTCAKEPGFIGTIQVIQPTPKEKWDAVFNQPTWTMYYSSAHWEEIEGKQESVYDIKLAVSCDGINWIPRKKTIIKLYRNEGGISSFRKIGDRVFYSLRNKSDFRNNIENSYRIKSQFIDNKDYYPYEFTELEPEGDETMCAYPFVIEEKDKYLMFYNGHDFGKGGISYAESKK